MSVTEKMLKKILFTDNPSMWHEKLPFHIPHRHLRVVVLVCLGRRLAVELDGLLRAKVDAGEALRAVVAAAGFAVREGDVPLRAHVSADAAAHAEVSVDGGREHRQCAALHTGTGTQRAYRSPPRVMQTMRSSGNLLGDALQPRGVLLELPDLLVGVAPEADSAVVGHADFLAV